MTEIIKPDDWDEMSFGEKWMWILEKQREISNLDFPEKLK
jgi:hypothetical protein